MFEAVGKGNGNIGAWGESTEQKTAGKYMRKILFSFLSVYLFDNGSETTEGEPMTVCPGDDGRAQLDDDPLSARQLLPAQERRLPSLLLQAQRGAVALVYRVETPAHTE